jgi:hypothetical protein
VYEYIPTGRETLVDRERDGKNSTHEDGTRQNGFHPAVDDYDDDDST